MWAAEWRSNGLYTGKRRHLLHKNGLPALFCTRRECREWIKINFGYIKHRKDLRKAPHNWRMPQAVRVKLIKLTRDGV
jgi:hypothetical protein